MPGQGWLEGGLVRFPEHSGLRSAPLVAEGSLMPSSWSLRLKLQGSCWFSLGSPRMALAVFCQSSTSLSPGQISGKGPVSGRKAGATGVPVAILTK